MKPVRCCTDLHSGCWATVTASFYKDEAPSSPEVWQGGDGFSLCLLFCSSARCQVYFCALQSQLHPVTRKPRNNKVNRPESKNKRDRWWGAGDNRGLSLEAGTHNLQPSAEDAAVTLQDIRSCCKRRMTTAWKQQRSLHVLFFPDISKKMGSTWGFEPFVIFIVSVLINDHPL